MGPLCGRAGQVRDGMGEQGDTGLALVSLAVVTNEVASVPSRVCSPGAVTSGLLGGGTVRLCLQPPLPRLAPAPTFLGLQGTAQAPPSCCQTLGALGGHTECSPVKPVQPWCSPTPLLPESACSLPKRCPRDAHAHPLPLDPDWDHLPPHQDGGGDDLAVRLCPHPLADPMGTAPAAAALGCFEPSCAVMINPGTFLSRAPAASKDGEPRGGPWRGCPGSGQGEAGSQAGRQAGQAGPWRGQGWRCGMGCPHGPCVGQDGWQQSRSALRRQELGGCPRLSAGPRAGSVQVRGPGGRGERGTVAVPLQGSRSQELPSSSSCLLWGTHGC